MSGEPTREMKYDSYQSKVCKRLLEMLMNYTDNNGVKIFERFKGHIFYNAKKSIPTSNYPALFIFVDTGNREPFGIRRQDLWNINIKVYFYTLDHSENSMDDHYKWVEGLDRVCRINPRWHISGKEDLSIHKGDLNDYNFDFAFGDNFVISETEADVIVMTKLCLANQVS